MAQPPIQKESAVKRALLLLPLFFLTGNVYSETWSIAALQKGNPATIYILDNDSVRETENGTLTARIAEVRDDREKRVDLVLQSVECDCSAGQVRYGEAKGFLHGKETFTDTLVTHWVTAKFESLEEVLLEGICNNILGEFNLRTDSMPELIGWAKGILNETLEAENKQQ